MSRPTWDAIIGELGTTSRSRILAPPHRPESPRSASASQLRLRRRLDHDDRAQGRQRLRHQRIEVLDHQGTAPTSSRSRAHRRQGFGGICRHFPPTQGFKVARRSTDRNHASDTAELSFEDCRIPQRYVLGQENTAYYI